MRGNPDVTDTLIFNFIILKCKSAIEKLIFLDFLLELQEILDLIVQVIQVVCYNFFISI